LKLNIFSINYLKQQNTNQKTNIMKSKKLDKYCSTCFLLAIAILLVFSFRLDYKFDLINKVLFFSIVAFATIGATIKFIYALQVRKEVLARINQ